MKQINDDIFNDEVLESQQPVMVDFYTQWCPPCKRMMPVLEQFAANNTNLKVLKVDIEDSPIAATNFSIDSVPTFIFFKGGEVVKRLTGVQPLALLQQNADLLQG